MKTKSKRLILIGMILIVPSMVEAHPGGTDSNGCHTCHKNCAKWGLSNGEYHCHNNGNVDNNTNNNTNNNNYNSYESKVSEENIVKKVEPELSGETGLKEIKIDNKNIDISDSMVYTITNNTPKLVIKGNEDKEKISYKKIKSLNHGDNDINIKVEAENGDTKEYNLLLKVVNNDTTLKMVKVDNTDVIDNMKYSTTTDKIDLSVLATDVFAKVKYDKNIKLKDGDNIIDVLVTAEDGITTKKYTLNVKKIQNLHQHQLYSKC